MFKALVDFLVKYRILVVIFWFVLAGVLLWKAPLLSRVGTTDEATFLPANAESVKARDLLNQKFPGEQAASSGIIVIYRKGGLNKGDTQYVKNLTDKLSGRDRPAHVSSATSFTNRPELTGQFLSKDRSTALIQVNLSGAAFGTQTQDAVASVRNLMKKAKPGGLEVHLTGQSGILTDFTKTLQDSISLTTIATVILVIIVLMIVYRSPVAIVIPLTTIAIAFFVGRGILGILAANGWKIPSLLDAFIVVLVFGAGTDYCLFLISRFKEEARHDTTHAALSNTLERIGSVITASAGTVILAFLGMSVARFGMFKTMGPALALSIAIALIAALTLAPAMMSLFGRYLFWPFGNKEPQGKFSVWREMARVTTTYPVIVIVVVIAVLGAFYTQLPRLNRSFDTLKELPQSLDSVKGFNLLQRNFARGDISPSVVLVPARKGDVLRPVGLSAINSFDRRLAKISGVSEVRSLVHPAGVGKPSPFQVKNQLDSFIKALSSSPQAGQSTAAASSSPAGNLTTMRSYFAELRDEYPRIKNTRSYESVIGILTSIGKTPVPSSSQRLAPAQARQLQLRQAQMLAQLKDAIQSLSKSFDSRQYLYSTALVNSTPQLSQINKFYISKDHSTVKSSAVLKQEPFSSAAFADIEKIRSQVKKPIPGNTALITGQAIVGGSTADSADIQSTINTDSIRIALLATLGILIILALLLRSAVAPWYLVATVIFSYGATLSVSTFLFQDVLGQAGMSYFVPIILFVLLVALGSDYNIFLISRIREESIRLGTHLGVQEAAAHTGGIITSAGIILAGTFAALGLSPLQSLFQTGIAVTIGVLIDTFIIRAILVPAIGAVFGDVNWWPAKIGRPGEEETARKERPHVA
ncbi:MAG: MMPL family transporter [Candidatus Aquicultor sp.]